MTKRNRPKRYCALCDYWYEAGSHRAHQSSDLHKICLRDLEAMERWYATNARGDAHGG